MFLKWLKWIVDFAGRAWPTIIVVFVGAIIAGKIGMLYVGAIALTVMLTMAFDGFFSVDILKEIWKDSVSYILNWWDGRPWIENDNQGYTYSPKQNDWDDK